MDRHARHTDSAIDLAVRTADELQKTSYLIDGVIGAIP
jgi:hypothetical protein